MRSPSRRHTNEDFASKVNLLLAEIGFLGIMFFIFIGNIQGWYDKGILELLPLYQTEISSDTIWVPASHILHLDMPDSEKLYCEGKPINLKQLDKLVHGHLHRAIDQDTTFFVSLRTERAAAYLTYIAVKDIILTQQRDRINELSRRRFGEAFSLDMPFAHRKILQQELELGLLEWTLNKSGPELIEVKNGLRP